MGQKFPIGTYYNARSDTFISAKPLNLPSEATEIADIHTSKVKVEHGDAYEKQFEVMDINAGLGVSILARLTPLQAPSLYLSDRPKGHTLHTALHHTFTTIRESLKVNFSGLKDSLAVNETFNDQVTHIVVEVEWGARSIISVRQHMVRASEAESSNSDFESSFVTFLSAVETLQCGEQPASNQRSVEEMQGSVEITAFSDILDDNGILMGNFQEAYQFLRLIPLNIKDENGGRGVFISYSLLPVEMLFFLITTLQRPLIIKWVPVSPDCLRQLIQIFSEFETCQRYLDDLAIIVQANEQFLPPSFRHLIGKRQQKRQAAEEALKLNLTRCLNAARNNFNPAYLQQLLVQYQQGE